MRVVYVVRVVRGWVCSESGVCGEGGEGLGMW